jgi:hypothetical protein
MLMPLVQVPATVNRNVQTDRQTHDLRCKERHVRSKPLELMTERQRVHLIVDRCLKTQH